MRIPIQNSASARRSPRAPSLRRVAGLFACKVIALAAATAWMSVGHAASAQSYAYPGDANPSAAGSAMPGGEWNSSAQGDSSQGYGTPAANPMRASDAYRGARDLSQTRTTAPAADWQRDRDVRALSEEEQRPGGQITRAAALQPMAVSPGATTASTSSGASTAPPAAASEGYASPAGYLMPDASAASDSSTAAARRDPSPMSPLASPPPLVPAPAASNSGPSSETSAEGERPALRLPGRSAAQHRERSASGTMLPAEPAEKGTLPLSSSLVGNQAVSSAVVVGSSLAIVLVLFFAVAWVMRKSQPRGQAVLPGEVFELLGRAPLSGRQQVYLLRLGRKLVLVSITPAGAETLAEVTDPEEVDRLAGACQQGKPTSVSASFQKVFSRLGNEAADSRAARKTWLPRQAADAEGYDA